MVTRRGNITIDCDMDVHKGRSVKQWFPLHLVSEYLIAMIQTT